MVSSWDDTYSLNDDNKKNHSEKRDDVNSDWASLMRIKKVKMKVVRELSVTVDGEE